MGRGPRQTRVRGVSRVRHRPRGSGRRLGRRNRYTPGKALYPFPVPGR
ncbi:hypothetical protein RVR_10543 [Actinacidiphila reveromycinica]|uniref:Uncharacterized protein n=1 Tax=Actinacidiphila reveromycinica TaxID=659352 RepID=A0A7U3UZ75_9ACTN|nr:hypothetical protein RVR_10543 [Streptomyces sp. SN-593]